MEIFRPHRIAEEDHRLDGAHAEENARRELRAAKSRQKQRDDCERAEDGHVFGERADDPRHRMYRRQRRFGQDVSARHHRDEQRPDRQQQDEMTRARLSILLR